MADDLRFESPVVSMLAATEVRSGGAPTRADRPLTLADRSGTHVTVVRAASDGYAAAQLGARFGASRTIDDVLVCGQRPGEWVLLGTAAANDALVGRLDRAGHVSVIDLTHGRALFRLTGERATSVLEKLCSIDWSDEMTPDGAVTSGSVAKVACDLVRDDTADGPSYLVACDRSFGQYLFDAILDAGTEFDLIVA